MHRKVTLALWKDGVKCAEVQIERAYRQSMTLRYRHEGYDVRVYDGRRCLASVAAASGRTDPAD